MKTKLILAAALAAVAFSAGIASAAPKSGIPTLDGGTSADERILVEMKRGGSYYGPGPNYYMQDRPGPNCYPDPHPVYGYICY